MTDAVEFSRPAAVAAALGADSSQRFMDKLVLLRGEADFLCTRNGHEAFRAAFLLLIRICENVRVSVPTDCDFVRRDIGALAAQVIPLRELIWVTDDQAIEEFDAILSVGRKAHAILPWTVINADGWLARVSSRGEDLPHCGHRENVIAAVAAACLGVGEVFKRLIELRPERGELLAATSFSLWAYELTDDPGPDLRPLVLDILLAGCGAIGSGNAYLLSRLNAVGRVFALDRQKYQKENFGTSIIVGPLAYNNSKAEVVADLLSPKYETRPFAMDIGQFQREYDGRYPDIVLSGLDEVAPRHEVQQLWPSIVIDGAVGGDLSCQVSCCPWKTDVACLLCVFQEQAAANLAELNAQATGLPLHIANDPQAILTEEVVASAEEGRRTWLRTHLGKPICSITAEAAVKFLSAREHERGFAPAVPFVSCFSACLSVTELVRYTTEGCTLPAPRYQLSFLWGPRRGAHYEETRRPGCFCVDRARNIDRVREGRRR